MWSWDVIFVPFSEKVTCSELKKSEQFLNHPIPNERRRIRKPEGDNGKFQVSPEGYTIIGLKTPRKNPQPRQILLGTQCITANIWNQVHKYTD